MKYLTIRTMVIIITLMMFAPLLTMAQPAQPGDGTDPFATPVNGGVALVACIAFLYGGYRIYQLVKNSDTRNSNT